MEEIQYIEGVNELPSKIIFGFVLLFFCFLTYRLLFRTKYLKQNRLMSKAESKMFNKLKPLEGSRYYLFAQVRIADVVGVSGKEGSNNWWRSFRKISSKHIDFVFVSKIDMKPLVAIELDDLSHEKKERIKRDKFINHVFKESGLPLVRFTTKELFSNTCNFKRLGL